MIILHVIQNFTFDKLYSVTSNVRLRPVITLAPQCVLKMDHHCPWVGNCVGFTNYKYFVLFLFYTCLYTLFITVCCIPYITNVWRHRSDDPLVTELLCILGDVQFCVRLALVEIQYLTVTMLQL